MDYRKTHPVLGVEATISVTTDGGPQLLEPPFGRVRAVICLIETFRNCLRMLAP